MKSIFLLATWLLFSISASLFGADSEVKIVGKCLTVSTAAGQVRLIPLRSIISVKVSAFYEDNVGAADKEVKGYIEIVTTALVMTHRDNGVTAVNERIRVNGMNFAEAREFGAKIQHALAYSENTDKG